MKGRCVICGDLGPLTRDHVPPKGVTPPTPIEVRRLIALTGVGDAPTPRLHFQAQSFPSLCRECNSERLGSLYDPHLIAFSNRVSAWVRAVYESGLVLPAVASVRIRPSAVAHAVAGHLLAAEDRSDPTEPLGGGTLTESMRAYFLGTNAKDAGFRIFLWPYSGSEIIVVRGFGMARVLGKKHGPIVGDILKYFPLAFWVVGEVPANVQIEFAELDLMQDSEVIINIPLRVVPHAGWPERPMDNEIVLINRERSHVARRVRRSRPAT